MPRAFCISLDCDLRLECQVLVKRYVAKRFSTTQRRINRKHIPIPRRPAVIVVGVFPDVQVYHYRMWKDAIPVYCPLATISASHAHHPQSRHC